MHTSNLNYYHQDLELHGFIAFDEHIIKPRPAVLVAHDWSGRNDFACQKAQFLAEQGYVGFAIDVFGQGKIGLNTDEKMALITPFMKDRLLLRDRLTAALDAIVTRSEVDKKRVAIIGFCFGGLCALDLARSGAPIKGAVSFHGLLNKPEHWVSQPIKAKILALHGYDDPMVEPNQVHAFCKEMTEAKVDWQMHMYGNVQHAFTNPEAHDTDLGTIYHPLAEKRSMMAMINFLDEIFKE